MWDLPSHLASLNSLSSPSGHSAPVSAEQEEAFWEFMHTDELFDNFGVSPATHEAKEEKLRQDAADAAAAAAAAAAQQEQGQAQGQGIGLMGPPAVPAPTPASTSTPAPTPAASGSTLQGPGGAATLESFIAAFANDVSAPPSTPVQQNNGGVDPNINGNTFANALRGALSLPLPFSAGAGNNNSNTAASPFQHILPNQNQNQNHTPTLDTLDTTNLLNMSNFDFTSLGQYNLPLNLGNLGGVGGAYDGITAPASTPAVSSFLDTLTAPPSLQQQQKQKRKQEQEDKDQAEADRISGAKKLKSLGAGPAEIEEDKRRRNTEASARFRAKKKERESALEIRAKELEVQVAQLAADNASLSNENKLLKAIVLGSGQGDQLQDALANASAVLSAGPLDAQAVGGTR